VLFGLCDELVHGGAPKEKPPRQSGNMPQLELWNNPVHESSPPRADIQGERVDFEKAFNLTKRCSCFHFALVLGSITGRELVAPYAGPSLLFYFKRQGCKQESLSADC